MKILPTQMSKSFVQQEQHYFYLSSIFLDDE